MGIRVDGASDLISASDGTLTIEGQSVNTTGIVTASGGVKVGTAATIHSTGQFNIGVAATIFANGNATFSGIVTAASYSGIDSDKISELNTQVECVDTGSDGHITFDTDGAERARFDPGGRLLLGATASQDVYTTSLVQIQGTTAATSTMSILGQGRSPYFSLGATGGSSLGAVTAVAADARLGQITFCGADGTDVNTHSCSIAGYCDGSVSSNTVPGRIVFKTSTGASELERIRITSAGKIGINTTATSSLVQLYGAQDGEGTVKGQLTIKDTAAYNATPQAGVIFQIHHASDNSQAIVAGIRGLKANAADGDYDGCLAFDTRKHGQVAHEAARFTEDSNLKLPDDAKIELGGVQTGSGDLQIYHTAGDYSYIKDGSGRQYIQSNRVYMQNNAGDENLIYAEADDGVYLYFNNSTKLATTNTGVSVTGSVTPSGGIYLGGAGGGNYLDDYEKGTWTPAINSGFTVSMHASNQGHYIKVGKLVYYQAYVRVDTLSGSSGETYAMIKGLPFAHNGPGGIESNIVVGWTYGLAGDVYYGYIDDNTTQMVLLDHPSSGSRDHLGPGEVWQTGARMSVSGCYEVD